jgi:mRNA interferase RelE/StbE
MTWSIEWTDQAIKDARHLDQQVKDRLVRAIERLAETGQGDVVKLREPLQGYRLRVGDWRISFEKDAETCTITVKHVRHRSEAYRRT